MNLTEPVITIDAEHSIEFGEAPWDETVEVIRRRKNNSDGSYDPISSSVIPINEGFIDISRLFLECLIKDKISREEMAIIRDEITASFARLDSTPPPSSPV